jgi:formylglycine-generating enzyme required for sulfatase activity
MGGNEPLPINCATWYEAFAFCIWDGGRLPTEAEWNYAAAGGNEQRVYPWGGDAPTDDHAVFQCYGDSKGGCAFDDILPVGAKLAGNGKWGHADLAGSMWEWARDRYAASYDKPCQDCAHLSSGTDRVLRGGDFHDVDDKLFASNRYHDNPADRVVYNGFRCARSP